MPLPDRKIFFETTRIGDELTPVTKAPIDRVQLARYAGASGDFNPLWLDDVFARAAGLPSVLAPPGLAMGFLGQLVTDWARGSELKKFNAKFSRMLWPGDTLTCKGRVFDRHAHNGNYFLELELWAENQRGELAVKGHATLKLFYSAEDEQRARSNQPPIVVNVNRSSLVEVAAKSATKAAEKAQTKAARQKKPTAKKNK